MLNYVKFMFTVETTASRLRLVVQQEQHVQFYEMVLELHNNLKANLATRKLVRQQLDNNRDCNRNHKSPL